VILIADACALPFADASFDTIITAPPWDDLDVVMRARPELRRVLTRKGQMVMILPNRDDPRLATLAVADRDWTQRSQYAIDKPNVNRGWLYRSLSDGLVRDVLIRSRARRVLDPFMGSGTVPRVARSMGVFAVGCDISPAAIKVAVG
jgi:tRNA G10  N-methylase Trm11